jgi:hypothetical protein
LNTLQDTNYAKYTQSVTERQTDRQRDEQSEAATTTVAIVSAVLIQWLTIHIIADYVPWKEQCIFITPPPHPTWKYLLVYKKKYTPRYHVFQSIYWKCIKIRKILQKVTNKTVSEVDFVMGEKCRLPSSYNNTLSYDNESLVIIYSLMIMALNSLMEW